MCMKENLMQYRTSQLPSSSQKIDKYTDVKDRPKIRKEVENTSGIGEALVTDARLDDLEKLVVAGKIESVDEAKQFYPTIDEDCIQEIFDSLRNKD